MIRCSLVFIFVIGLCPLPCVADDYIDSTRVDHFKSLQGALYNNRFLEADSLCRWHSEHYPNDPAGYLFQAAVILSQMMDREEDFDEANFRRLLDTVEILTTNVIDTASANTSAWMYVLRGHARVYQALREGRFGSVTSSVRHGIAARKEYETGLSYDSTVYDLYFGLGAYHYWKSARAGILRWLGILKNEIDKGLSELALATDSSLLSRESARNAMIWIWLDRKEYDSAAVVSEQMYTRYPEGKVFLWPLGDAYYYLRKYRLALETFQELRMRVAVSPGNYYNLIECDYRIYHCLEALGLDDQAKSAARRFNEYYPQVSKEIRKRQSDRIKLLRKVARL